ncbi:hypothetical protein SLE2022_081220 [Rubroshorea leprosula]
MEEFRHSYKGYRGGRNLGIIDENTLRSVNRVYVCRSQPSFDRSFDLFPVKKRAVKARKSSPHSIKSWWNDPEMKRKRRVARYKIYTLEGKIKGSIKKASRWIKKKCSKLVQGS